MTTYAEHVVRTGKEPDPGDPPIFLLQASPAFAGGILPDGAYQRVQVGSAGQVLTVNADGSIGWSNSSAGFSNPMTTTGDMIYSSPGSTPVRLAIGSGGQVLAVVSGVPAWSTAAAGFTNPMTTSQDLIVGGVAGAAGRLGVGANGQVLTVTSGLVGWANSAAGFANPMTTLGDLITGASGGTAQRLGVGGNAQVLTVVSGQPAWANSASGFANPMTALGDLIVGGTNGTPLRLPGQGTAPGEVLTWISSSAGPSWLPTASNAVVVVLPSGDTTGVVDQANITAAWTSGLVANGGEVFLAPGAFYVKPTSGNNCLAPPQQTHVAPQGSGLPGSPVCIRGSGASTIIYPIGAGVTGIYMHRSSSYGAQFNSPAQPTVGYLKDFVIDGSLATGASTGIDCGDGWGGLLWGVRIANFATTGATGLAIINRVFWTEKWRFWVELQNNSTQCLQTTNIPGSDHSHEYNLYDFIMFCNQNQQGVIVDGVNNGGSQLFLRGNMCQTTATSGAPTNNTAMLTIRNTTGQNSNESRWYFGEIWAKVEFNQTAQFPTGTVAPYGIFMDGTARGIQECSGLIGHSLTNSNINGAEFSFRGLVGGDPNLAQAFPVAGSPHATGTSQPSVPTSGTALTNGGPDFQVFVTGANITGVSVNGIATGASTGGSSATLGGFFVCAAGSITLNYTGATPTWVWAPASQSS